VDGDFADGDFADGDFKICGGEVWDGEVWDGEVWDGEVWDITDWVVPDLSVPDLSVPDLSVPICDVYSVTAATTPRPRVPMPQGNIHDRGRSVLAITSADVTRVGVASCVHACEASRRCSSSDFMILVRSMVQG
jgi:hypothetical protein